MYVQLQVGVGDADVWSVAGLLSHLVDYCVFYFVCYELGVSELLAEDYAVNGECCFVGEVVCPVDLLYFLVHFVGGGGAEVFDGHKDAYGCSVLEVGSVEELFVSGEGDHASSYLYVVGSEVYQFCCQYCFQALEGLGYHFELFSLFCGRGLPIGIFHVLIAFLYDLFAWFCAFGYPDVAAYDGASSDGDASEYGCVAIDDDVVFEYGVSGYAFDGVPVVVEGEAFCSECDALV